jgi:hypothetical protein
VVVPADVNLDKLHDIIQVAMGWSHCHLYEFCIGSQIYTYPLRMDFDDDPSLDAKDYCLNNLVTAKGDKFYYVYDFGDDWRHKIIVEDSDYKPDPKKKTAKYLQKYPVACLGGRRNCPPEGIGGHVGYNQLNKIIKDPNTAKHQKDPDSEGWEELEYHRNFDGDRFDLDSANSSLCGDLERTYESIWELME